MKNRKVVIGAVAVVILLGGYLLLAQPTAKAKKICARIIVYRPATSGVGEYYAIANDSRKFRTSDEAMEACIIRRKESR